MKINGKKCNICNKEEAVYFRCVKEKHFFICDSERCDFLSLLRAGVMKLRDLKLDIQI